MEKDTYLTLQAPAEGFYKEKGSKFTAFAYPVEDEAQIKQQIELLKKKYFDARHHCYAYILGPQGESFRANDDGEPGHSAGDPILGQIRSANLTNTLIVVVRYFGGTKLGVSGLIQAYKTAAAEAIDQASIIEKHITTTFSLKFSYPHLNWVMKLVKDYDLEIIEQQMALDCAFTLGVRLSLADTIKTKLKEMHEISWQ